MKRPLFVISLISLLIVFSFNFLNEFKAGIIAVILLAFSLVFIKNRELKAAFFISILLVTASSSYFYMQNEKIRKETQFENKAYTFSIYDVKENARSVSLKGRLNLPDGRSLKDMKLYISPGGKYAPGDVISISAVLDFKDSGNIYLAPKIREAEVLSKGKTVYLPYYYTGRMRKTLNEASLTVTNKEISTLFPALLTGSKNYLTRDLKRSLYEGGISHIAAVSGLHLSIILSFVFFFLPFGKRTKLVTAFFLCFFVAGISAFSPSVLRASLMVLVFLSSGIFKRRSDGITSLGLFIFLTALLSPRLLFSLSTWFSCLSVFGILSLAPYLLDKLYNLVRIPVLGFFIKGLLVSFSATALTLPVCLYFFGSFSALSIFINVLVVPLVSLILPLLWVEVLFILIFKIHIPLLDIAVTKLSEAVISLSSFAGKDKAFVLQGRKLYVIVLLCAFALILSYLSLKKAKLTSVFALIFLFAFSLLFCDKLYTSYYKEDIFAFYPEDMSCAVIKNKDSAVLIGNLTDGFNAENMRSALRKYGVTEIEAFIADSDESASAVLIEFLQSFNCPAVSSESVLADNESFMPDSFIEKAGGKCTYDEDEISFALGEFTILKTKKKCDIINNYRITESRGINVSRLSSGVNLCF